jgi:hypothetical protein
LAEIFEKKRKKNNFMKVTINITKKIIIRIITLILMVLISVFIFLYFKEYNTVELTKQEIIFDLKQIETENIFDFKTTDYLLKTNRNRKACECSETIHLQPDFMLTSANEIVTSKNPNAYCCGLSFYWIKNDYGEERIEIEDKQNKFYFTLNKNLKGTIYAYTVVSNMEVGNDQRIKPNQVIKIFVQQILDSHEFTLLRTDSESHYDYLIKDLGDKFLIYTIPNHIENPDGIWFQLYSKKKNLLVLLQLVLITLKFYQEYLCS